MWKKTYYQLITKEVAFHTTAGQRLIIILSYSTLDILRITAGGA